MKSYFITVCWNRIPCPCRPSWLRQVHIVCFLSNSAQLCMTRKQYQLMHAYIRTALFIYRNEMIITCHLSFIVGLLLRLCHIRKVFRYIQNPQILQKKKRREHSKRQRKQSYNSYKMSLAGYRFIVNSVTYFFYYNQRPGYVLYNQNVDFCSYIQLFSKRIFIVTLILHNCFQKLEKY